MRHKNVISILALLGSIAWFRYATNIETVSKAEAEIPGHKVEAVIYEKHLLGRYKHIHIKANNPNTVPDFIDVVYYTPTGGPFNFTAYFKGDEICCSMGGAHACNPNALDSILEQIGESDRATIDKFVSQ